MPVIRSTLRMELPSTKAAITVVCCAASSLFIKAYILERIGSVKQICLTAQNNNLAHWIHNADCVKKGKGQRGPWNTLRFGPRERSRTFNYPMDSRAFCQLNYSREPSIAHNRPDGD